MPVQTFSFPNTLLRQALIAIEGVVGNVGFNAILRRANMEQYITNLPPDNQELGLASADCARLNRTIQDFFGRGSPAILYKIGEVVFENLLVYQFSIPSLHTISDPALTHAQKCRIALIELARFAEAMNPNGTRTIAVSDAGVLHFTIQRCSICWEQTSATPVCQFYAGVVSAAIRFTLHRSYRVKEIECSAMGAPHCRFEAHIATPLATLPAVFDKLPAMQVP
jgi:bacteriochlorophyll 4-vinyl reductase